MELVTHKLEFVNVILTSLVMIVHNPTIHAPTIVLEMVIVTTLLENVNALKTTLTLTAANTIHHHV